MARQDEEAPVQVEYVSTHDEMAADPAFADFSGVFERFQSAEELLNPVAEVAEEKAMEREKTEADALVKRAKNEGAKKAAEEKRLREEKKLADEAARKKAAQDRKVRLQRMISRALQALPLFLLSSAS